MRGAGEGHRPWDLRPESTMTNATVADLAAAPSSVPGGQKLTLKYKDGEKTVIVPPGVPVVSFKPGNADQQALLVPGAKVMITAQEKEGKPTALRGTRCAPRLRAVSRGPPTGSRCSTRRCSARGTQSGF